MKNKKIIEIILLIIIAIAVGLILLKQYEKGKENQPESEIPTSEPEVFSLSGIYTYDDHDVYLFEKDNMVYYSLKYKIIYGRTEIIDGKALIEKNGHSYNLSLIGTDLNIVSDDPMIFSATYERKSGITESQFFENAFGKLDYFNSNYNGFYQTENGQMYVCQTSENEVLVLLQNESDEIKSFFDIENDNLIKSEMVGFTYTIIFDNENALVKFSTGEEYIFQKQKKITIKDIMYNNLLYTY